MGEHYQQRISKLFEFKKVQGYQVEVNRFGEVRNIVTKIEKNQSAGRKRIYASVSVKTVKGKFRKELVHILVALAWIGPKPSKKHQVNHKDLDKSNNYYKNLEWCTPSQNIIHAIINGVNFSHCEKRGPCKLRQGENHPLSKLNWKKVRKIRKRYKIGNKIPYLSRKYNVDTETIRMVVKYKTWKFDPKE